MPANQLNFMPPNIAPETNWKTRMRNVAGGDTRFFDYGQFGLLNDNSVLRSRVTGPSPNIQGKGNRFRGSGNAPTNFSGGKTSDDPGGYNWNTLNRNLGRGVSAAGNLVNFRMESKRVAKARTEKQNEEALTNTYNTLSSAYGYGTDPLSTAYSGAANQSAAIQAANQSERTEKGLREGYGYGPDPLTTAYTSGLQQNIDAEKANKSKSSLEFSKNVAAPSQNFEAGLRAEATDLVPGSVSPIKGRKSRGVNLLDDKMSLRRPGASSPYSGPQPPAPPRP